MNSTAVASARKEPDANAMQEPQFDSAGFGLVSTVGALEVMGLDRQGKQLTCCNFEATVSPCKLAPQVFRGELATSIYKCADSRVLKTLGLLTEKENLETQQRLQFTKLDLLALGRMTAREKLLSCSEITQRPLLMVASSRSASSRHATAMLNSCSRKARVRGHPETKSAPMRLSRYRTESPQMPADQKLGLEVGEPHMSIALTQHSIHT